MSKIGDRFEDEFGNKFEVVDVQTNNCEDGSVVEVVTAIPV